MKRVTGLASLALLVAGPAFATDLAVKAPMYKASPQVFSWAGWYIGGNAGYGWGENTDNVISATDPANTGLVQYLSALGPSFPDLKPKGFVGGGQFGYNWQSSNWVYGLVADFQGADITAAGSNTVTPPGFVTGTQSISEKVDFLGTVRGKVGYAADNWLFYGSGGLAYGHVNSTLNIAAPAAFGGTGAFFAGSESEARAGWAIGGGVNYALTHNWIVGLDYLHYDLGRTNVTSSHVAPGVMNANTISASQVVSGDIVRATIDYKF